MSRYFPGQVKQPRAGDGIDCERVRWAEEQALDKAPAIKDTLSIKTDISAPNGAPIISIKS